MEYPGWLASTDNFEAHIQNPEMIQQLKPFSIEGGKGPFLFEVSDVTRFDSQQAIFIQVFDEETKSKIGEVEVTASLNEIHAGSNEQLLKPAIDKLGWLNKYDGLDEFNADHPAPDAVPDEANGVENNLSPQDKIASYKTHAARLLKAILDENGVASTGIPLVDGYKPSSGEFAGFSPDVARMDAIQKREQIPQTPEVLMQSALNKVKQEIVPTPQGNVPLAEYLRQANGDWNSVFQSSDEKIRQIGRSIRTKLDSFLQAHKELSHFLGGKNLTTALVDHTLENNIKKAARKTASIRIAAAITALDSFIEQGDKAPFILDVKSPAHIPTEVPAPSKLHTD